MKIVKLLSDFDGIWTNQAEEAEFVHEFIIRELYRLTNKPELELEQFWQFVRKEMDKSPHEYGWKNNGEVVAFYGEDPFGDNNAVFDFTEKFHSNEEAKGIKQKILDAGFESLESFSNYCFTESTKKFRDEGLLGPCKNAKEIVGKLLQSKVELTVASNSGTDKIEYLFAKMGYGSEVRARGGARKFVIEKTYGGLPYYMDADRFHRIPLRRKYYYDVLLEEKPDFIIGDVLSLDTALPIYLKLNNQQFKGMKITQKIQTYTPEWVKDFLGRNEFREFVFMIEDIGELPGVIEEIL